MFVNCQKCGRGYDDAVCWTLCPHGPLWATVDAYCREHDLVYCMRHGKALIAPYPEAGPHFQPGEHLSVRRLDLTPEEREGLTCRLDNAGAGGRRQWYDELEEAGWTKQVESDGSVLYQRPYNGSYETITYRQDGSEGYSRPLRSPIVAPLPPPPKKAPHRGFRLFAGWKFWRSPQERHASLPRSIWNARGK